MKRSIFLVFVIISLAFVMVSCSNGSKRSRKPVSSISIMPGARNYIYGQTVSIQVKTKVRNGQIDNIRLFYKERLLKESRELEFTAEGIRLDLLGRNTIRVVATKTDSVSNSR